MYEPISSRIYKAFDKLCYFFNDYCIGNKCKGEHFKHCFKERGEKEIKCVNLSDVFFLDKDNFPSGNLVEDSMIVINKDPRTIELKVFKDWIKAGWVKHADRLSPTDMQRLYVHIKTSEHISAYNRTCMGKNFNAWKKAVKDSK